MRAKIATDSAGTVSVHGARTQAEDKEQQRVHLQLYKPRIRDKLSAHRMP